MNGHIVTTFSPAGYERYGKRFIDSYLAHQWPGFDLHVFGEDQACPEEYEGRLTWRDLKDDPQHEAFCERNKGKDHPTDFNEMPVRFGHKVFAVTSPRLPKNGWRVWIDADVEFTAKPTLEQLYDKLFQRAKALTFLGRRGLMRPGQEAYTECGFVGYNMHMRGARKVLRCMRHVFVSDGILRCGSHNKHDSYVFDSCRRALSHPDEQNNLSAHCPPQTFHVWPHTVLAEFSTHQKGPRRKKAHYGK